MKLDCNRQLVGVMSVYNDNVLLRRCLPQMLEFCNRVVVVDGSYKGFPVQGLSDDGTLDYLRETVASDPRLTIVEAFGLDENDKRSLYLTADAGDWYFMLDADEEIQERGDIEQVLDGTDAFTVRVSLTRPYSGHTYEVPRFFRHEPGMRYGHEHWHIYAPDGRCLYSHDENGDKVVTSTETYAPFVIQHNMHLREQARKEMKAVYFNHLNNVRKYGE